MISKLDEVEYVFKTEDDKWCYVLPEDRVYFNTESKKVVTFTEHTKVIDMTTLLTNKGFEDIKESDYMTCIKTLDLYFEKIGGVNV